MNRLCLDTSAYSNLRRNDASAIELIAGARWLGLPVIVIGELRSGFRSGARRAANERGLDDFIRTAPVEVLEVDEESADIWAQITADARASRTGVASNDAWIAALAVRSGSTVVTYDADFRKIPRVSAMVLERT
jgi:predicted nucleic acid-binding protein